MPANNGLLSDNINIGGVVYDSDGAYDGTAQTMVDMQGWDGCLVLLLPAATTCSATNRITGFKVVSNSAANGSGTDHDVATAVTTDGGTTTALAAADMGTDAPTTIHTQLMALDIRASEIYPGDRYIAAVTTKTGTYTMSLVYIRYRGFNNFRNMIQSAAGVTTRTAFQKGH